MYFYNFSGFLGQWNNSPISKNEKKQSDSYRKSEFPGKLKETYLKLLNFFEYISVYCKNLHEIERHVKR